MAATTTGAEFEAANFRTQEYGERASAAMDLCHALGACAPEDAAQICTAFLETCETSGPESDTFGRLHHDARWWADIATPRELVAYGAAALDRLRVMALAKDTRKRLLWRLWSSLGEDDRTAFLQHIAGRR